MPFISKLAKELFQRNPLMALLIWSVFFLKMPYLTSVWWWIADFEIEFNKYYLIMAIFVKRWVDTWTHHQIWLRGEDKISTGHRFSLNVSRFINNLLQPKLRSCGLNFRTFKGSCITGVPVARLCIGITNGNNWKGISCRNSIQG